MNRRLLQDNLRLALQSVRSQRLRTWLTAFIISFGIMALVGILSATDAIEQSLAGNFSMLGANTFTIRSNQMGFRIGRQGKKPVFYRKITFDEAHAFKERFTNHNAKISVSFIANNTAEIKYGGLKTDPNVLVWAVDAEYIANAGYELAEGRNFSSTDISEGRPVIIIGQDLVTTFFETTSPLGKIMSISGKRFQVIGVLAAKGSSGIFSGDRVAFVPITNARKNLATTSPTYAISVMAPAAEMLDGMQYEATAIMRAVRKLRPKEDDNFVIERSDSLAQMLITNLQFVATGAFIIGMIALFGASIALMNIMLVSVTERTREIGTRKGIGAKAETIRQQFLFEAIAICQLGGVIGVILGLIIGNLVATLVGGVFFVPWLWITVALVICLVVGVLAGLYPAIKASKLDPIEALRYE